jgi:apolipoprotein N-acyltransferase
LIRVTNTGYTAVINATGEVIDEIAPFTEMSLIHQLKVETAESFYTRHGDVWAYFVIGAAVLIFIYTLAKWLMGPVRKVD